MEPCLSILSSPILDWTSVPLVDKHTWMGIYFALSFKKTHYNPLSVHDSSHLGNLSVHLAATGTRLFSPEKPIGISLYNPTLYNRSTTTLIQEAYQFIATFITIYITCYNLYTQYSSANFIVANFAYKAFFSLEKFILSSSWVTASGHLHRAAWFPFPVSLRKKGEVWTESYSGHQILNYEGVRFIL